MALTKVYKVDNQLRIEVGNNTSYGNASWYAIAGFTDTSITLMYHGRTNNYVDMEIFFADFQDNLGNSYSNMAAISNYLAPLIG